MESKAKWQRPFISYSRIDQEFALRLADDLGNRGKTVWIDTGLQGGEAWAQKLDEGLEASDVVLLIVSRNSQKSPWVNKELHSAQDPEKPVPVIPVIYKRCGRWSPISDLQKIDFIGWYEEGLAKLLELPLPPRPWWRRILIQLNRHGVQMLLILIALAATLVAYRYYYSPSATDFSVIGADPMSITLLVKNGGGRPSTLLYPTFHIDFGPLPIPPRKLVAFGNQTSSVPGHGEIKVSVTVASIQPLNRKPDGSPYREDDVAPMIDDAAVLVKGSIQESDQSIHEKKKRVPASQIQRFIMGVLPNAPTRFFEKTP
jgi:hypothetical protein